MIPKANPSKKINSVGYDFDTRLVKKATTIMLFC